MNLQKVSVVIPCYNEENWIVRTVNKIFENCDVYEVLIIDDGSTDSTIKLIKELKNPNIKIISNYVNLGKGQSLKNGFKEANGDIIVIQDADNEYNPEDIKEILNPFFEYNADFVIGNRFQPRRSRKIGYFAHTIFNRLITNLVNIKTNKNFSDIECGYKAFRKNILDKITLNENSFSIEVELVIKISRITRNIYEVGVDYHARSYEDGKKIKFSDVFKALLCLFKY
jgi:glycosyltransferase involved in cell wall biosynthesis